MKARPPIRPTHIIAGPKDPSGMKIAPIAAPKQIRNLRGQKLFWMWDRGSLELFTPSIMRDIRAKKHAMPKQIL